MYRRRPRHRNASRENMKKDLSNKVALITGSTRGIGKAIAFELASQGAIVLLHGSAKTQESEDLFQKLAKISPKSKIYYAHIENVHETTSMTKAIEKNFKHIDILINNAGIVKNRIFLEMNYEEWDSVFKVNVYGTFYTTKLILPFMIKTKHGKIINMSSISGLVGEYGQTNYCASKFAIIGFTKALSKELGKYSITVNAICPAIIASEAVDNIPKKYRNQLLKRISLRRAGKKEEVAKLAAFLASDDANYITGQAISIDGGMY